MKITGNEPWRVLYAKIFGVRWNTDTLRNEVWSRVFEDWYETDVMPHAPRDVTVSYDATWCEPAHSYAPTVTHGAHIAPEPVDT